MGVVVRRLRVAARAVKQFFDGTCFSANSSRVVNLATVLVLYSYGKLGAALR